MAFIRQTSVRSLLKHTGFSQLFHIVHLFLVFLVLTIGRTDLESINSFIGDKVFLLGEQICDTDASLFGVLSELRVHNRGPLNQYLISKHQLFHLFHFS